MSEPIDRLEIEVESSATSAVSGIDALASSLGKLKNALKGGVGLSAVSKQLTTLNTALNSVSQANAATLNKLTQSLQTLSNLGNLKLSSSIATQITNIGTAVRTLDGANFGALAALTNALAPLATMSKANLNSFISQLQRLPQAVQAVDSANITGLGTQVSQLVVALKPLSEMGRNNLTSFITQLSKIPALMTSLKSVNIGELATQIRALANAFAPLANEMQRIAMGFSALPARLQRLINSTNGLSAANRRASTSYVNFAAKIGIAVAMLRIAVRTIGSWIGKSNKYIEDMNLFDASMGSYAENARKYAEHVGEVMGIDPGQWMRNQGIFMTLATGFGVISDRAFIMSKNLTQLGYDISSFFNISFDEAMLKLQSGLAGELEPLRRIGYDLSVARLQQEAYTLGIKKKVQAMTQAEKAELRYYAIMTQVKVAQGDMARTLNAPANQLRILKAQVEQCARALGNIFIPALNAILPYAIAVAKVIRMIADMIAGLMGFSLPEIDYSGLDTVAGGGAADALGDAADNAKKLKNNLLGIDELNIISKDEKDSGPGGAGNGGGLGFELPEYDFLGDAINSKIDEIFEKMKEWLGLTEPIKSWADFMKTRLFDILALVGAIAAGLLTWKLLNFMKNLGLIPLSLKQITGLALAVAGAFEYIMQFWNAWVNGVDLENFIGLVVGAAAVIGGLGLAFGTIAAAIGAVVTGIGMFVLGIKDAVTNGLNLLNGVLIPLGATLTGAGIGALIGALGGPIGAGIGALIGLAVGLIVDFGIWLYQNWDEVCAYFDGVMLKIQGFFKTGWNNIVAFVKDIPNKIINAFNSLDQWVKDIPAKFKAALDSIGDSLDALPGKIKVWFSNLTGKIKTWFSDLWQPIRDYDWGKLGYDIGQWFGKAVKSAYDFVTETVPKWFKDTGNAIKEGFKTFFTSTLPTFFKETLPKLVQTAADFFKELPERIGKVITSTWNGIVDVGKSIIDGIVEGLQTVWQAIKDFVSGFVQGFKDALGIHSPSTVFKEIGDNIVAGLLQGIKGFTNMANTVKQWSANVVEWFTKGQDGKGIVEHFKDTAGGIINGFKDKIGSTYTTAKNNVTTWATGVKEWFESPSFGGVNANTFSTFANATIEGFKNKIGSAYTNAKSSITTWADKTKEWFTSSSFGGVNMESFSTFANNTIEGFKNKIGSAYQNTRSNITTWASGVKEWFTSSSFGGVNDSSFATFANNVLSGFREKIGSAYINTKANIVTWATNVKSWFSEIASSSAFSSFATNVIDGFKGRISDYYSTAKSAISTWGTSVMSWFKEKASSSSFYQVASDVVSGFSKGIGELYSTCKRTITSWGDSIIDWFKDVLGIESPSKRFYELGGFSIAGFNNAIMQEGRTTQKIVGRWADSFTNVTPHMKLAMDTSALKYYDSVSFAKSVSSNVTATTSVSADGFKEAMEEFYQDHLASMADDVRRQADKQEQTTVQIGNRTITDAVTTQQKANGYRFVTT